MHHMIAVSWEVRIASGLVYRTVSGQISDDYHGFTTIIIFVVVAFVSLNLFHFLMFFKINTKFLIFNYISLSYLQLKCQ